VRDLEERLLYVIRRVEQRPHACVEARLHHAPEPLELLFETRCQRLAIAAVAPLDRVDRVTGCLVRECPYTLLSARRSHNGTGKMEFGIPRVVSRADGDRPSTQVFVRLRPADARFQPPWRSRFLRISQECPNKNTRMMSSKGQKKGSDLDTCKIML
jgi:hypothetical protein